MLVVLLFTPSTKEWVYLFVNYLVQTNESTFDIYEIMISIILRTELFYNLFGFW